MLLLDQLPVNYVPIIVQLFIAAGFVGVTMCATHFLGPSRRGTDKMAPFESGVEVQGNARQPISIKYFLVAILFVLFDLEVIFMYPWAVNFRELGGLGMMQMFTFMALLLAGLIYVIKKGALKWE